MRLLVADTFQAMQDGKTLAVGLFADGVVVMNIPPEAPEPTDKVPFGVDVNLLVNLSDIQKVPAQFDGVVTGPTGIVVASIGGSIPSGAGPNQTLNVISKIAPLVVFKPGRFTVALKTEHGETAEDYFEVRINRVAGATPGHFVVPAQAVQVEKGQS
jgi:hypothetical protein